MFDVIRGKSNLPEIVLAEMAEEASKRLSSLSEEITTLTAEIEKSDKQTAEIRKNYQTILKWSDMFDSSDMAVKKMIAGYLIRKVTVYSDYRLHIEFNINLAQFELGIDIPNEYLKVACEQNGIGA